MNSEGAFPVIKSYFESRVPVCRPTVQNFQLVYAPAVAKIDPPHFEYPRAALTTQLSSDDLDCSFRFFESKCGDDFRVVDLA